MPLDRRTLHRKIADLAGDAEVASIALRIFDDLEVGDLSTARLTASHRYQLGLLASFFESAQRGSLEDVKQLADAHRAAATSKWPMATPPSLDDDERRWSLVQELTEDEAAAREIVKRGLAVADALHEAKDPDDPSYVESRLVPFLDQLAHADKTLAQTELAGYHSLHR